MNTKSELTDTFKTLISERQLEVNGASFRVRSIFSANVPLENALATIAKRKLAELKAQ